MDPDVFEKAKDEDMDLDEAEELQDIFEEVDDIDEAYEIWEAGGRDRIKIAPQRVGLRGATICSFCKGGDQCLRLHLQNLPARRDTC